MYLSKDEEELLKRVLGNGDVFEADDDELLDRFECKKVPSKENIRSIIMEIGHKQLFQKRRYIAECWREILTKGLVDTSLSSILGITSQYEALKSNTRKVIGMLQS